MSTLAEIEEAISILPADQVEELSAWLSRHRSDLMRESGPGHCIRDFFGCCESGDPRGADNERLDADLAREAGRGL